MMRLILFVLLSFSFVSLHGQCDPPGFFTLHEDMLCRNSSIKFINQDIESSDFYWDFCPEDFLSEPVNQSAPITGFVQGYGYRLVQENGQWYGFVVSRSLDKLFRLDFGGDPSNSPDVVDLGNPGSLMDAPEGIDLYKDGNNWFAFVGKGENSTGQVVKLSFGDNLTNTPSVTGYGTFGQGSVRIRDLSVVKQGDDIVLLLLIYNTSSINRVNFGNSLENPPGTNNIVPIPGSSLPRGLEVISGCSTLRAHIVSENGLVQQISFASDVLGPVTVEGGFTFSSVVQPWKVRSIFNRGKYYLIISNNARKYSIVDFGDLSLSNPPVEVPNNNDIRLIGLDVIKYDGKSFIQGAGGTISLFSVSYQNSCGLIKDYSNEKDPSPFQFVTGGTYGIDRIAFENVNEFSLTSKEILIQDLDAPEIEISYQGICEKNEVIFLSSNTEVISSYLWNFGNGLTSYSSTPTTLYSAPGMYSVFLEAEGTNSCFNADSLEIKIYSSPVAEFTLPPNLLCTNNSFTFPTTTLDNYDGNLTYEWFVDDNPVSTTRDLTYTFTTTGPKEIRLKTGIPGCSDEITKTTSSIQAGPMVDFLYSGTCEHETFHFQHQISEQVETYSWDFGNGQSSTDPNPTLEFQEFGNYDVSLAATNTIGCENVKRKTIAVHSKPMTDFYVEGPPNACSGTATFFENQSTSPDGTDFLEWQWEFNDPDNVGAQHVKDPEHTFTLAGTYNVRLTSRTTSGCDATTEKEITINQSPSTDFSSSPACDDLPVVYSAPTENIADWYWEIGTAYYTTSAPTHTFRSPGDYPLYLEVTGSNGCISTRTQTVHVPAPLTPDFSLLKNCVNHEAVFSDITTGSDPVRDTEWIFDGETYNGSPVKHTFAELGNKNITLKVTTESGCSYRVEKQITILPHPVAAFSTNASSGAYPLEVSFTNASSHATHFLWKFIDGTGQTSTEESPGYIFNEPGTFDVELTAMNEQQCEDSYRGVITTISPLPDVDLEMITLTPNPDGSVKLIVTIHNKGNTILKNLPVDIDFSGSVDLRQIVEEPILPDSKYNFVFSTGILNPAAIRYLCVSLKLENDLSPNQNRMCQEFRNSLLVLPAFPNPTSSIVNLEWISAANRTVRIWLTDALGQQILNVESAAIAGLNRRTVDLKGLPNGIYNLVIEDGTNQDTQRILVFGNP